MKETELEKINKETFGAYTHLFGLNEFDTESIEKNLLFLGLQITYKAQSKKYKGLSEEFKEPNMTTHTGIDRIVKQAQLPGTKKEIAILNGIEYLTQITQTKTEKGDTMNFPKNSTYKDNLKEVLNLKAGNTNKYHEGRFVESISYLIKLHPLEKRPTQNLKVS